ncbi:MAG TPA: sulfite reductase [Solibacillus sp.]
MRQKQFEQNFEKAMALPMPTKTFAKLNVEKEFVSLTIRPGLINKHLTQDQLIALSRLASHGAVKYSAGHGFIVSVHQDFLEEALEKLTVVGLYAVNPQPSAVVKCCDFCDGERLEALSITEKFLQEIEQFPLKKRIRIGLNACTSACYNAVRDDIALIYHDGKFDLYAGAIQMGRRANSGELLVKKIDESKIIQVVYELLQLFERSTFKEFHGFIRKEKLNIQQTLAQLL